MPWACVAAGRLRLPGPFDLLGDGKGLRAAQRTLAVTGLQVLDVCKCRHFVPASQRTNHARLLAAAAYLGARFVNVTGTIRTSTASRSAWLSWGRTRTTSG